MSEAMAFSFVPQVATNPQRSFRHTEIQPAGAKAITATAWPRQSSMAQTSHLTFAAALAAGLSTALALKVPKDRRQRRVFSRRGSTTRVARAESTQQRERGDLDSESVLELAKKANVKLEVRPWQFLSGIAKEASRGWFVKRAEDARTFRMSTHPTQNIPSRAVPP
eukprot:5603381-Amphidinium_carterae.1